MVDDNSKMGDHPMHTMDSNRTELLRRTLVPEQTVGTPSEEYNSFVKSILQDLLAPSTRRLYRFLLEDLEETCKDFNPLSEEVWMRWIKRKLQTLSPLTVAGYIKSAQVALFSRGIDLTVQNPRLNNLLSRVSARLRKFGTLTAQAVKNTDLDRKPVVSLGMIKTAFIAELNKIAERD